MSVAELNPAQSPLAKKNAALWDDYQQQKSQNRMLFPLEGAKQLQVSELELMLASPHSQYLGTDCHGVLQALTQFSKIESIVRNELAVHEKLGQLQNLKLGERMGIALNVGGLDLRFFMSQWHHILAVTMPNKTDSEADNKTNNTENKTHDSLPDSFSIQFYDGYGSAICKVFLRDYSDTALQQWQDLVAQHAKTVADIDANIDIGNVNEKRIAELETPLSRSKWQPKVLATDKQQKLQRKWLASTDIHQFHMLLKSLDVDRASSYRQAPEGMTQQLQPEAIEALLLLAKQRAKPIMVFVGNNGVVQIQTGVVHQVKRMGDWINILDKKQTDFTLHLKDKALAQVWCVKRPTKDGIVTCIEGFDEYGASMVTFFGQRQEGEPEREYWQEMTAKLVADYALDS